MLFLIFIIKKVDLIKKIKNLSQYKNEIGLFESRNIYLIDDVKNIEGKLFDKIKLNEDVFVFIAENSPKNKSIKNIFLKEVIVS